MECGTVTDSALLSDDKALKVVQYPVYDDKRNTTLRGVIEVDDQIIGHSFSLPQELKQSQLLDEKDTTLENYTHTTLEHLIFHKMYQGSVIRLVYIESEADWVPISHKRILNSGNTIGWGARSFRAVYDQFIIPVLDFKHMDKNCVYILLLTDDENRTVLKQECGAYHIGTLCKTANGFVRMVPADSIGLPQPQEILVTSKRDLYDYLENLDVENDSIGVVATSPYLSEMYTLNIVPDKLEKFLQIRNNDAHLVHRVLQLSVDGEKEHIAKIQEWFPKYAKMFSDNFAMKLIQLSDKLRDIYNSRYVDGQFVQVDGISHKFILGLKKNRSTGESITSDAIQKSLEITSPHIVMCMMFSDNFAEKLPQLSDRLRDVYNSRYIDGQFVQVDKFSHMFILGVKSTHTTDEPITSDVIQKLLETTSSYVVKSMLTSWSLLETETKTKTETE